MDRKIVVFDVCESTNSEAKLLGHQGAPHGSWVSALRQTGGRGRTGRKWESRSGNLYLSYIARIPSQAVVTWIPLAVAVAVCRAIDGVPIEIKWPNDLRVKGRKLGGILCEGVGTAGSTFQVVGIGINVVEAPEGLDQETTSLKDEGVRIEDRTVDLIRARVVEELDRALGELVSTGAPTIRDEYLARSELRTGDQIEWNEDGLMREGRVRGLGSYGELLVSESGAERVRALFSEEVRQVRTDRNRLPSQSEAAPKASDESPV